MSSGTEPKSVGEGESLVGSVKRLEGLLDSVQAYVNDVVVSVLVARWVWRGLGVDAVVVSVLVGRGGGAMVVVPWCHGGVVVVPWRRGGGAMVAVWVWMLRW